MSTAWCLSVAFLVPWVVGVPVAWFARGCRALRPADWLWVPFLGLTAIVCPLQSLCVFADLPLARTVPAFGIVTGTVWAVMMCFRAGRRSVRSLPWRVVALTLIVYLGQGAGVIVRGVESYRGDLQSDQYPYVVLAQFLMDEPFSTDRPDLSDRAWLVLPLDLKPDRIGQSVVHGFIAVAAGHNALDTFFPTLLLGPGLMVPAVFLLGTQCGLSRFWTTWAALAAGLAPGVEVLVSLCFLSHSLGDTALVAFLASVIRLARAGGSFSLVGAMATFVLGCSVYTEFAPLFVGVGGAALAAGVVRGHLRLLRAAGLVAALVLSLGLNPAAVIGAQGVWQRGTGAGATMTTGHRTSVWVSAVWLNFDKAGAMKQRPARTYSHAFVYGSTAAALLGAGALVVRALRSRRRLLPTVACVSLLLPPLALWIKRPEAAYAVGKLVLTLAPVLVVFIASGAFALERLRPTLWSRGTVRALAAGVVVILGVQSGMEQWNWLRGGRDVGLARLWNEPDLQDLCTALCGREPADVVIALSDPKGDSSAAVACGAVCYAARNQRIRLAFPLAVCGVDLHGYPAVPRARVEELPAGTLVVARRGFAPPGRVRDVVFENNSYQVMRIVGPAVIK
ncbi:hypothetical protein [Frigoriglobus tundricola]|uniref:Glycosyltransferase RgtA/B/C/D-like domain-containing protein n=1 Tax=Frigoriglobus tundricola TaxID=2774151 RepID=A0A6M5Z696_9BACT|nr:hypothetical protein [Frigoriglobus tundricola]QJX00934.1 hypothetical protein FTUN_8572 [Frigoriglobus tundricola]